MKKIISLVLAIIFISALCSCGGASTANKLVYGEKYVRSDYVGKDNANVYVIFNNDRYADYVVDGEYTIHCRYEVMDEGVLCLMFHSIDVKNNAVYGSSSYSTFNKLLMFSENNLVDSKNGNLYIRESFAKTELPDFGK